MWALSRSGGAFCLARQEPPASVRRSSDFMDSAAPVPSRIVRIGGIALWCGGLLLPTASLFLPESVQDLWWMGRWITLMSVLLISLGVIALPMRLPIKAGGVLVWISSLVGAVALAFVVVLIRLFIFGGPLFVEGMM